MPRPTLSMKISLRPSKTDHGCLSCQCGKAAIKIKLRLSTKTYRMNWKRVFQFCPPAEPVV